LVSRWLTLPSGGQFTPRGSSPLCRPTCVGGVCSVMRPLTGHERRTPESSWRKKWWEKARQLANLPSLNPVQSLLHQASSGSGVLGSRACVAVSARTRGGENVGTACSANLACRSIRGPPWHMGNLQGASQNRNTAKRLSGSACRDASH
jgi:hypothetical protein